MIDTTEGLLEEFYKHSPLVKAMIGKPISEIPSRDIKYAKIAGGDFDCDLALIETKGDQIRWSEARLKVKALALFLNRYLVKKIDGKLPKIGFGEPTEFGAKVAEFKIGRDMSGFDDQGHRFASDGEAVILFEKHRAFFTPPSIVDLGELEHKPVSRIRMEMFYYVLKEK